MSKKVIMAIVDGVLCIDPVDLDEVNLETIKDKLREKFGKDITIKVAPISTWMPQNGTEALMENAIKKMDAKALMASQRIEQHTMYNNRHARRAMAKTKRNMK